MCVKSVEDAIYKEAWDVNYVSDGLSVIALGLQVSHKNFWSCKYCSGLFELTLKCTCVLLIVDVYSV